MRCFLVFLHAVFLISSGFTILPAPDKLSMNSVNFHHVLHWEPGPGTPPGTEYRIIRRVNGKERLQKSTNGTSSKLKLHKDRTYKLTVQASYNQTLSPPSREISFTPFRDTTIGPPELSVVGCGTCLQVNITLPKADCQSNITDLQVFYDAIFKVLWKKENERKTEKLETHEKNITLTNLEKGASYCVQVHTKIRTNQNTKPSVWYCNFTSPVEIRKGPFVLGIVSALCVLVIVLMMAMFLLFYTGFLCELKKTRPRALMTVLSQSPLLTPDRVISQRISVSSDTSKQRNQNGSAASPPETTDCNSEEDCDDEEDDKIILYLDRDAEHYLSENSQQPSGDAYGSRQFDAPEDSGGSVAAPPAESGLDQDAVDVEGAEVVSDLTPVPEPDRDETEEDMDDKDIQDICDHVNFFSVIVASVAGGDEEEDEEESLTD